MSFIKKYEDQPKFEVGQTVKASIIDLKYPIKGQFEKENIEVKCQLETGYICRAWITYYREPYEKSTIANLLTTLMKTVNMNFGSVDEALDALKSYGKIFLRCIGFRKTGIFDYPKFKVVTDILPSVQASLQVNSEQTRPRCPNCNQPLALEAKFCINCGFKLR